MKDIKVIIRQHEEEYVRYLSYKKKGDNTQRTKLKIKAEAFFLTGFFNALRMTMDRRQFQELCDWDYELLEELYKMYGIE